MKKHYQSILGVAVGAAMLSSGCSAGDTVGGKGRAAASKASPLKFAPGEAVGGSGHAVSRSYLSGYFTNCSGRAQGERWDLELSNAGDNAGAANNLRVALNDTSCQLWADSIVRRLTSGHWDSYYFFTADANDDASQPSPIRIGDDFDANNVRAAYPYVDGAGISNNSFHGNGNLSNAALVNVKAPGVSTFTTDFNVHVLSGASAADVDALLTSPSNLTFVSASASQEEFPPSTYSAVDFSAGATLYVDGNGVITSTSGTFTFTTSSGIGGTSYSYGTIGSRVNVLGGQTDSQHYNGLRGEYFTNFNAQRGGTIAGEGSFEINIESLFPTSQDIFDNDSTGVLTMNATNYNTIIVRRQDPQSAVASYQMFEIRVQPPAGSTLFPPATLSK